MHHTNTRIYQASLELIELCAQTIATFPPGYAFLCDQLRRASASIALNFAEGSGKASRKDRRRFFVIAKASALETAAALDIAQRFGLLDGGTNKAAQDRCDHIAAMLHKYR